MKVWSPTCLTALPWFAQHTGSRTSGMFWGGLREVQIIPRCLNWLWLIPQGLCFWVQTYLSGQPCLKASRASCYEVKSEKLRSDGDPEELKGQPWESPGFQGVRRTSSSWVSMDKAWWGLHWAECEKAWHLPLPISAFPLVEPALLCPTSPQGCSIFASSSR